MIRRVMPRILARLIAIIACGLLIATAIAAGSVASARRDPDFVGVGAAGIAQPSGDVELTVSVRNGSAAQISGTLRIGYQAATGPTNLVTESVNEVAGGDAAYYVDRLPAACGSPLLVTLDLNSLHRDLTLTVSCVAP